FFFASFDPPGYVTLHKPPLTFSLQTITPKIFPLHPSSLIFPQPLPPIPSLYLIYPLVKPTFRQTAPTLAPLIIASTPIPLPLSPTNNIDSL
ncbi:glycosyltransferase family 39 protein, partial [Bacillus sp. WP8]|uniref:glycosyltransferase family 39 protein n=1 Tax=Bacillus sp. WP8 TaxID=756828 RepID=UPI0037C024FF